MTGQWQFWVDRGGTFTDIVAKMPDNTLISHKLLSNNPAQYNDATVAGIKLLLSRYPECSAKIANVRIGTTVATNALLERKGQPTALITTRGFGDSLSIGYQHRDDLFALNIKKLTPLYCQVIEINERIDVAGAVVTPLCSDAARDQLVALFNQGITAVAIVFMHGYKFPAHELLVANIATEIGFTQVSISHEVSQLIKFVSRGDTTVVDAYLSPILRQYVRQTSLALKGAKLEFMQSSGGLVNAENFRGKDAVLSGPAGGVVAMVETSKASGFHRVVGFDMGGTSTDVSLYNGRFERDWQATIAGVRLRSPMMSIHTVAAGGGSILSLDGKRLIVGPESAGAFPGPCCYRNDGPLTVTDINVLLGKIQPDLFGHHFGKNANQSLDRAATLAKFSRLTAEVNLATNQSLTPQQLASGYLTIAVEHMANAIKEVSVAKGHHLDNFAMSCFGGAGAQHACLVSDVLGIKKILIHPLSGVLSAFGMGLAKQSVVRQQSIDKLFGDFNEQTLTELIEQLSNSVAAQLVSQGATPKDITLNCVVLLRYRGSDNQISIALDAHSAMADAFELSHLEKFGFGNTLEPLVVSAIECEGTVDEQADLLAPENMSDVPVSIRENKPKSAERREVVFHCGAHDTPFFHREDLSTGTLVTGPAIIIEQSTTVVIEPSWQGQLDSDGVLHLNKVSDTVKASYSVKREPMLLEIFNNLFMHIAKEMGLALQASAMSVNIKERLDFSCAIFDCDGNLVANAPHMPVHLGSMGSSVKQIIKQNTLMHDGDSYLVNSPYHGGTHLPDLTLVTPVFSNVVPTRLLFFVASRGHHADVGGISPGSMPANSKHIEQEGVLFENLLLVSGGVFHQEMLTTLLSQHRYPARNINQNISDLKAQLAANKRGIAQLFETIEQYGVDVVLSYMNYVQDAADEGVRDAIKTLDDGKFTYQLDQGSSISVKLTVDKLNGCAIVDFSGTSAQQNDNFNAPLAVTKAAVLYVFRTLVDKPIALNDGCLRPLTIKVPAGSMLNPVYPAAVVAGNVETSQVVTDALYGALNKLAGSQGTMNNFTFGDDQCQYYETICGGSGAGKNFCGTDAIQTHMTNSRLTDPEVLENRFPVRLNRFSIRHGSGGVGQLCGGNGVIRELEFLRPMEAAILANRRKIAPFGLDGGGCGEKGQTILVRADGTEQILASCAAVSLEIGDKVIIKTPGGGGFGKQQP